MTTATVVNTESVVASVEISSEKEKYVRITNHGKLKTWVSHSLDFFQAEQDERSLILHSFPSSVDPKGELGSSSGKQTVNKQAASTTTSVIPRLISVAEIIKREYIKILSEKSSNRLEGLYQYNEVGTLEQLGIDVAPTTEGGSEATKEEARSLRIIEALSGKNHLRQTQSPYMRITLSTVECPELVEKGATFQSPSRRILSKSAKIRMKKRNKKQQDTTMNEEAAPSSNNS